MKRKVNQNYEFITNKGNCFVFKTYKLNNIYYIDIYKQSNMDGKAEEYWHGSRDDKKNYMFRTCDKWENYLENNY